MIVDENTKIYVGDIPIQQVLIGDTSIYGSTRFYLLKDGEYTVPCTENQNYNWNPLLKTKGNGYTSFGVQWWSSWTIYPTTAINVSEYSKLYIEWKTPKKLSDYGEFIIANNIGIGTDKPYFIIIQGQKVSYDTNKTISEIVLSPTLTNIYIYIGDTISSGGNLEDHPLNIYNIWLEK